jgi:hypothetical protein
MKMSGTSNRLSPRWLMQEMAFSIVEFLVRATSRRYSTRVPIERIRQHLATDSRFRSTQEIQPIITNLLEYGWIAREYNQEESAKHAVLFWATAQANPKSESEWASVKSFPDLRSRTVYPDLYADQQGVESPGLLRIRILRGDGPEFSEPPESTAVPAQEVPPPTVKTDTAEPPECKFKDAQSNPIKIYNLRPGIPLDPTPLKDIGVRVPSQVARTTRDHMMEQFIMMNPGVSIDTAVLQASAFGCRAVLARRSVMSLVELGRIVEKGTFLWPSNYSESFKVQLGDSPTQDSAPIVDEPEPETELEPTLEPEPESASNTEVADDQTQDQEKDAVPTETNTNFRPSEANTVLAHDPKVEIYHEAHLLVRRIAALPANDRAIIHTIVARMEQ